MSGGRGTDTDVKVRREGGYKIIPDSASDE